MRSNTIFAAGFVAASAVMAAPVEVRADNAPLLPASQGVQTESTGPLIPTTAASQGVQTESTGPLIPTTSASQAPLTTETTGPLIPTTSASASGAQTTETTGPLIPTTTASGSAFASSSAPASSGSASGSSTGTASHSSTASGNGTATSSGTATGTSTASSSSGTGTATRSSATSSSTGTASSSSTASASGSGSASGSSTGPAPTSTVTVTGTGTQTVNPPVTSVTPPPQVLTVLTTITEDFTEYVTYVPVTITNGGSGSETITVTQTVTEQNTVTVDGNGCAPTGTSTQTPPPPHPTGSGSGSNSFYPSAIYHYDVSTGAITCGVEDGLIEKFPTNKGQDITTLVTFTYPEESAGKKCQFEFFLSSASTLEGSGKIDVFTSLAPAPGCKAAWPPGNQRNVHAGRLSAHVGAFATWDATYGASYLTEPTDCKAPGTQEGIELVGVYDEDHVAWFPNGSGARIIYN